MRDQATRWQEAEVLRGYRNKMASEFGSNAGTKRWIEWIDSFVDKLDPLTQPPEIPEAPEESVEALQPFMPAGWSAQHPDLCYTPKNGHYKPYRSPW